VETPYGEVPDRYIRDMAPQEVHDFLKQRYGRRRLLKGAAVLGAGLATGPILWRQSSAFGATPPIGPQWIAYGADATSQMYVSWSAGTASGTNQTPPSPQIRWGLDNTYGNTRQADNVSQVPVPAGVAGEPSQNTFYNNVLLSGLAPGTTYHYGVSNDGATWGPDTTFTTGTAGLTDFRFTAFGDEAASATAGLMVKLAAAQSPAFHLIPGDLAYATPEGIVIPDVTGYNPAQWDKYLGVIGPNGAQSIPWQASVGAHETEPLDSDGYAGFVTRFPQAYDLTSGSPVVHSFTYGNVAFLHLDGNDLSAQEPVNNGYSGGAQTAWLGRKLAQYRGDANIDFIIVICNCCCYSSNQDHGSDGGLRDAWGPLFDQYQVDLVISGHVHAYERTNPMRAGQPTRQVAIGGTSDPSIDGTTYICAGGGGNGLYTTWYGTPDAGDSGSTKAPLIWRFASGDSPAGGTGPTTDLTDTSTGYSANRRGVWSCLVVDVTAPTPNNPQTSMQVQSLMPPQTAAAVTSISNPTVIDSITLVRTSASTPPAALPETSHAALLGVTGAAVLAGGMALAARRSTHSPAE
jgi:hypothetical protein